MQKTIAPCCSFLLIIFIASAATLLLCLPPALFSASGEEDCDDYYFGISAAPDFGKALNCYKNENRQDMIILMHANGEGVPASIQKALELFKAWQKASPDETNSLDGEALKKALDERINNPQKKYLPIQYCSEIAGTTYALGACASIKKRKEEKSVTSVITAARANLKPADAVLLDKVYGAFKAFKDTESDRMYQQFIDGSIRSIAALAQEQFVRDQFLKLIRETINQRGLKAYDEQAFKAADAELNAVYRQSIQDYSKTYENLAKQEASVETKSTYTQYIEDYKKAAKKAQLNWIKYRELLAVLARSVYGDTTAALDPGLSMQTLVTKIRVLELKNNPAGEGI